MPLGKKVRPSSASGKLETLHVLSILSDLGSTGERTSTLGPGCRVDKVTDEFLAPRPLGNTKDREQLPEWLERELLKQNRRRHSVTLGDKAQFKTQRRHNGGSTHTLCNLKRSEFINWLIDQKVSLDNLQKLKLAFEEFETGGVRSLDEKKFGLIVKKCLGLSNTNNAQIQELFMKIDYSGQGKIAWDEFCTYMQLEYTEREESVMRGKQVAFALPVTVKALCHGDPVLRIHSTSDGTIVTVQEDGTVGYWSPKLQLQKTKSVFSERPANRKPKYATDFVPMTQYNKLIIGTGDREIQLYELSSLEPYCQISALETVPLTLDYCDTGPDECFILYGDAQGCVNIILISSVGETLRLWKKLPKIENVPNVAIDTAVMSPNVTYIQWKVHQDWVTKVKYFQNIRGIVSTSNEESSALVIGCVLPSTNIEQQMKEIREGCLESKAKKVQLNWTPQRRASCDQTVFSIYKGVKTFDICKKHNLLVTGGMDRLIRTWNPYVPGKPTSILKGHSAPIFYLRISSEDSRIFSVSMDNTVKIWDIQDQSCMFTAHPKASLIRGEISACLYSTSMKAFFIAADYMALLPLKIRPQPQSHLTVSHSEPVMCCGYSEEFRQVVSCTEGSVVKVWDFDTGRQVFEFGEAHGLSAITCMTFDPKGRRLITGGRDGCLKIWNFNNGQCLKILKRDGECDEVCDCTYLKVHRNTYVMSVGWDRKIDIYSDTPEDPHHVQRPQPSWQDDLRNGHKDDILCIAQCPPSLLATSSYDGEILVWNVVSGHIQCRLHSPPPSEYQNVQAENYWRAHTSSITGLQIVDNDQVLLTSSNDCTVRLWSAYGEFIGTFGQSDKWNIHISSSWKHPAAPYDILIDPLSMPVHEILNGKTCISDVIDTDRTEAETEELKSESHSKLKHPPPPLSESDIEQEIKTMFYPEEHGKRLRHEIFKHSNKAPNHGGPQTYHSLKYFDIEDAPTTCVRPDLSLAGINPFISSAEELESTESK
ncbi:cilia- and flagella-associated protein 337 [Polymixia lowei]